MGAKAMCSAMLPASEAEAMAGIYRFLAGVFSSYPTEEGAKTLCRMANELGIPCPCSFSMDELVMEYEQLFVVPNPRYVAPYEFVFEDEWFLLPAPDPRSRPPARGRKAKHRLMGESTLRVWETYLAAGMLPYRDLPDHIANELRFLAYLSGLEAAATNGDGSQTETHKRFRQGHVLNWIGKLRTRVTERERLGYYGAALQVAETILEVDEKLDLVG